MDTEYCKVDERPLSEVPVPPYTEEEHGTWALLLAKQDQLVVGRACDEFIEGLKVVKFPKTEIPRLRDISARIEAATGWKIVRVDGLVHTKDFWNLLSRKIFPSTDFIRKRAELDYTPEPDMFHDLFGHTPLLTNPEFTEFFQDFGHIGVRATDKYPEDHEIHKMLGRIYWFTVEFGLIQTASGLRAYGSGSVSSPEEMQFCVSDKCRHHPFDIEVISKRDYDIWHLQEDVFVIPSFEKLGKDFRAWAKRQGV
ncbi:MAG: phenylalanine 4-monooxygenase [Bdellovibrionota bacterium]